MAERDLCCANRGAASADPTAVVRKCRRVADMNYVFEFEVSEVVLFVSELFVSVELDDEPFDFDSDDDDDDEPPPLRA